MRDQKDSARRRFDRWAPSYELDRRSKSNAAPQEAALRWLALRSNDRVLDVGCGTGAAVRTAAHTVQLAVGVDLSPAMIARAEQIAAGMSNVQFVVGDSENLPFPDEMFSAVLCSSSFHHYPEPLRALKEMVRVLSRTGRLVIAEPDGDMRLVRLADGVLRRIDHSHVRIHTRAELETMAREAGLSLVGTWPLKSRGYLLLTGQRD